MSELNIPGAAALFAPLSPSTSVGDAGQRLNGQASEAECAALAEQDGLVALRDLLVEAELSRRGREGL